MATAMILVVAMVSCFTGIESTPKITAEHVKREHIVENADNKLLASVTQEPVGVWQPGKAFYVTDSKIALALTLMPSTERLAKGDTLRYVGAKDVTSVLGKPVAEIEFEGPRGMRATYRADHSIESLASLKGVTIPFAVELSIVEKADRVLRGRELYVLTSEWCTDSLTPRRGRKFVPVKVLGARPANETFPIALTLADVTAQPVDTFSLMLSIGDGIAATRPIGSLLSTTNPRAIHPEISDANWTAIIAGQVREGMTRPECKLSLGRPANVERRPGYSTLAEIWMYDNGKRLIFEDGLLKAVTR